MPVFSSKYPSQTVQQLNAVLTEETGRLGRVVYLTDESYTVDERDDLIVLAATTSTGNYTLTFPTTLPANVRCLVVMPAAPGGSDKYVTSGLGSVITFDAAGLTLGTLTLGGSTIAENSSAVVPPDPTLIIGDGTGTTYVAQNKSNAGAASYELRVGTTIRGRLNLDSSEVVTLTQHDAAGAVLGAITFDPTTGAISLSKATTIAAGGLTVTAGGFSLVAGDLVLTAGVRLQANLPSAADDAAAAALSPAVPVGGLYHTAGAVKQRLV